MYKRLCVKGLCTLAFACLPSLSFAAAQCIENINSVITHQDGNFYFQSSLTCPNQWCKIDWGSTEKNKNAYAMLLTAKATGKRIAFYWPNLASCSYDNPVFTTPAYMFLID